MTGAFLPGYARAGGKEDLIEVFLKIYNVVQQEDTVHVYVKHH